jgi:hypothetical protein
MKNILEKVNEALKNLENYGLSPMKTLTESFMPRGCTGELVLEVDAGRSDLRLYTSLLNFSEDIYTTLLQLNCDDSITAADRFFISDTEDGNLKLGRVIHLDGTCSDSYSIREAIIDFLDSSERERNALSSFIIENDVDTGTASNGSGMVSVGNKFMSGICMLEV